MGGMSSYNMTLEMPNKFKGAILMAPALLSTTGKVNKFLAGVLSKIAGNSGIVPM
jgi:acylglycerol lipase